MRSISNAHAIIYFALDEMGSEKTILPASKGVERARKIFGKKLTRINKSFSVEVESMFSNVN